MSPAERRLTVTILVALLLVPTLLVTSCGGGGSTGGDRDGDDTPPFISALLTPTGLQGARGVGADVRLSLNVGDAEFDPADVEIEYGVDRNGDGVVAATEYVPATVTPVPEGLESAPGTGRNYEIVWKSDADVPGGRFLSADVVYDAGGREIPGPDGNPLMESRPGIRLRVRAVGSGGTSPYRYSDPIELDNNFTPGLAAGEVEIPPEGAADGTVNEEVLVGFTIKDENAHRVRVVLDWVPVPEGFDPSALDAEQLAALDWHPGSGYAVGGVGAQLDATPDWTPARFAWDSVADVGTVDQWIMLRYRLLDEANEPSDWACLDQPIHLDNFELFTDSTASLAVPRTGIRLARLPEDRILVTGGEIENGQPTDAAGVFHVSSTSTVRGVLVKVPNGMLEARSGHSATELPDGRVLVVGGTGDDGGILDSAEVYDPETNRFTSVDSSLLTARRDHVAFLLSDGRVLLAGGTGPDGNALQTSEIFDPETESFSSGASLFTGPRTGAEAVHLPDGRILVAGGTDGVAALKSVEIYDPTAGFFVATDVDSDLPYARSDIILCPTIHPEVGAVAMGGTGPAERTVDMFDYHQGRFTTAVANLASGHTGGSAVLLGDGRVLVASGIDSGTGDRTGKAEIFDPSEESVSVPNGDMPVGFDGGAAIAMSNGAVAWFGGRTDDGLVETIYVFTPAGGANGPPSVQVRTPESPERAPYGVRFFWRGIDKEKDPVRIAAEFRVDLGAGDDSGDLPGDLLGRWLPASPKSRVTFGELASGLSGLGTTDGPSEDPIDAPDVEEGEHLFVWNATADLPAGDYHRVSFRIVPFGAVEGKSAKSGEFRVLMNAPAIARVLVPINDFGHLVVPFYIQDSNSGEKARVRWEFGIDGNGDGRIVAADGEQWRPARHSTVSVSLDGTEYTDAGTENLTTASDVSDPDNDYTDPNGNPWGKRHFFVWDSVYDLGAPASSRSDAILRVTPYDDPPGTQPYSRPGLPATTEEFLVKRDPDALGFVSWEPTVTDPASKGEYAYAGVRTNESIVIEFSDEIDPDSVSKHSIRIAKEGGEPVDGFFSVDNESGRGVVTFHPQVAERPARPDVLEPNTGYSLEIPAFDPAVPDRPVVRRKGVAAGDTNRLYLLQKKNVEKAFRTGGGVLADSTPPTVEALSSPDGGKEVPVTTDIEVVFGERIDVDSVTSDRFRVVAVDRYGNASVITGELRIRNVVDASGPGGAIREYARLLFTPELDLPAGAMTIQIRLDAGILDLAGNPLGRTVLYTFTTESGSRDVTASVTEEFEGPDRRNADETTAFWGKTAPDSPGTARGSGAHGLLTGLFDGGNGSDGELSFDREGGAPRPSLEVVLDTDKQWVWQFTRIYVPKGARLIIKGSKPAKILVQEDVIVEGRIDASGHDGQDPLVRDVTSPSFERSGAGSPGGRGGPGGADGGSAGSYQWGQGSPIAGGAGRTSGADQNGKSGGRGGGGSDSSVGRAGGAGGAGHSNGGEQGGDPGDGSGGAAGESFGSADLTSGTEGGSGGGAGGSIVHYDSNNSNVGGFASGGGGGGGGGALEISANGWIRIFAGGAILAKGGDGGGAENVRIYTSVGEPKIAPPAPSGDSVLTHPGGGGGGSGGTVFLRAGAGTQIDGVIDVRGGEGGAGYAASGADTSGGDGADGRIRLESPDADADGLVMVRGELVGDGDALSFTGNGTTDWIVGFDAVVDTDNGHGIPPGALSDGVVLVKDFVVKEDATLTVKGSKPLRIHASGKVRLLGRIVSRGTAGADSTSNDGSSTKGWKFSSSSGGAGGAGGGAGGGNGADGNASSALPAGAAGAGPSGAIAASSGGAGGAHGSALIRWFNDHRLEEYHFAGGGGGGGSAGTGESGLVIYTTYGYAGYPGRGGVPTWLPSKASEGGLRGGAGGGGGGSGGYVYDWTSDDFVDSFFSIGRGAGGGGGGGAIAILSRGAFEYSGTIDARGGKGGDVLPTSSDLSTWAGAGGGGGGGNVLLSAGSGFDLSDPLAEVTGGEPGALIYGGTTLGRGGRGGDGAVVLRGLSDLKLLNRGQQILLGDGTFTAAKFVATRFATSNWIDTGAWSPQSVSAGLTLTGQASLSIQGAQTDPETGDPDLSTLTPWTASRDAGKLAGNRWFRFQVYLHTGRAEPRVDRVKITWTTRN